MDRKLERATAFYKKWRSNLTWYKRKAPVNEAKKHSPSGACSFCEWGSLSPNRGARPLFGRICSRILAGFWYQMNEFVRCGLPPKRCKANHIIPCSWRARPAYCALFRWWAYFSLLVGRGGRSSVAFREAASYSASFELPTAAGSSCLFASVRFLPAFMESLMARSRFMIKVRSCFGNRGPFLRQWNSVFNHWIRYCSQSGLTILQLVQVGSVDALSVLLGSTVGRVLSTCACSFATVVFFWLFVVRGGLAEEWFCYRYFWRIENMKALAHNRTFPRPCLILHRLQRNALNI